MNRSLLTRAATAVVTAAALAALAGCGGGTTPVGTTGAAPSGSAGAPAPQSPATSAPAQPGASTGAAGGSGGASPVVDNACTVFTVDALRSSLAIPNLGAGKNAGFKPGLTSDKLPLVQCDWEQGAGGSADFTIHLDVYNFATTEKAKRDLDDSNVNMGTVTSEVLTGVADQALFARLGNAKPVQAAIFWRKGSVVYHLSAVRLAGVDRPTMEPKLKAAVVGTFS